MRVRLLRGVRRDVCAGQGTFSIHLSCRCRFRIEDIRPAHFSGFICCVNYFRKTGRSNGSQVC